LVLTRAFALLRTSRATITIRCLSDFRPGKTR
jgi:hypothetical protein